MAPDTELFPRHPPAPTPAGRAPASAPRLIRALLRKDWVVLQPRYRAGIPLVFLIAALQTVGSDEVYFWLGVALAGALALTVPVIEWRVDAGRLVASLPATRRNVVTARYLAAGIACAAACAVWAGTGAVLRPLLHAANAGAGGWATLLTGALTFAVVTGVLLAAILPLLFGLGLGRAAVVFLPVALGLVLVGRTLAGVAAPIPTDTPDRALQLGAPGAVIRWAMAALVDRVGGGAAVALSAIALVALWSLSARASAWAYRRRGL